ncbi:hypothetical protein [Aquihabitans sp. McL0605]|uniref:hypothetical protein n=1 Tax=Aquihabitans sp. McL0605 TaxID=3415671 RepID=UPI003CF515A5
MSQGTTALAGTDADDQPPKHPRYRLRQYVTGSWVIAVVAFTIARVAVAGSTLEKYGLNIWVFGFIDLITAVPYAIGVARVVTSIIDKESGNAMKWGLVAAGSFLAPYLYVAWSGRDASFPPVVWVVLGLLILGFGTNAVLSGYRKVRSARDVSPAS